MGLLIPRARPSDEHAVRTAVHTNWGGEDVPHLFDTWVKHRDGPFYVACLGDRVVGLGKLTRLSPGEAWLEGLRCCSTFAGCIAVRRVGPCGQHPAGGVSPVY